MIESGAYIGRMILPTIHAFRDYYCIENDPRLAAQVEQDYEWLPSLHLIRGDSVEMLPTVLDAESSPWLFWLDAHTDRNSPILHELDVIARYDVGASVFLIDDVRLMGRAEWPDKDRVASRISKHWPRYHVEIENDIMRAVPEDNVD
jgi:hypothetical protein